MKKLISLMLAVMLAVGAAGCFAESKDENEKTVFLQIKEGKTAKVFREAGGTEEIDTLQSGQFCGIIEETEHEGILWYHVFYMDSQQKGATGYIRADEAEQLTWKKLKELTEDPAKLNEILDLIDALNAYLNSGKAGTDTAGTDGGSQSGSGGKAGKSTVEELYSEAMDALEQIFSMDLSAELDKVEEAGKETAQKVAEAGEELLEALKDGAEDLFNQAKDAGEEVWESAAEDAKELLDKAGETLEKELEEKAPDLKDQLDELVDGVSDTIESLKDGSGGKIQDLQDNIEKAMDILDQSFGKGAGDALDKLNNLADEARKMMDSTELSMAQNAVTGLAELFREEGLSQGVQATTSLIELLSQINMD